MSILSSDILVIGGGMAGASIAAHLSERANVHVLDMEERLGYHSTGRSAALFSEAYGNATIRALTRASRSFLFSPPPGFSSVPLVRPRPVLIIGDASQQTALDEYSSRETAVERVSVGKALSLCPILRPEGLIGGILDDSTADIEVHELHQGYLRTLKQRGGRVTTNASVTGLIRDTDGWVVETAQTKYRAAIVVNAAGAWAEEIGKLAQALPIGLQPLKRTAALIEPPEGLLSDGWPMILDAEERFYMKPDAGLLLLSPADETPAIPSDVQPDELDIAIAIDRVESATTLQVRRVRSKWAGLRSFVGDRSPVVGYDPLQPGFFWLAALGGYGIQTAPAVSALAADLVLERSVSVDFASFEICRDHVSPMRFC
ncbi:MAG: FAD-binding oxidoreductase [Rhizomicrobium sp.]